MQLLRVGRLYEEHIVLLGTVVMRRQVTSCITCTVSSSFWQACGSR